MLDFIIDQWIEKLWYIYKKYEILPSATVWMDLECIMLSEIGR